jgi:hypothetical protein
MMLAQHSGGDAFEPIAEKFPLQDIDNSTSSPWSSSGSRKGVQRFGRLSG